MKRTTIEQSSSAVMQIILHAGDCRNLLNETVNALLENKSKEDIKAKITAAKKEITKTHVIQAEMTQSPINEDELQITLLPTHAQDTLMTISSEVNLIQNMIRLYRKLEKQYVENSGRVSEGLFIGWCYCRRSGGGRMEYRWRRAVHD